MEHEVRYCAATDGARLAYCVEGEGPPLMVLPLLWESFSLNSLQPELEHFLNEIGAGRTLIFHDTRGTGLSQRGIQDLSLDALVSDMNVVADTAGFDRFAIWAPSINGMRAIKYAAEHQRRIAALILYGTYARARDLFTAEAMESLVGLARSNWELFCRMLSDWGAARLEAGDAPIRAARHWAESADAETIARLFGQNDTVDLTHCLADISAPTLVIHRIADSVVPLALGQAIAAGIPGAKLVTPPGAIAGFLWGDTEAITRNINAFLDGAEETRAVASMRHTAQGPIVRTVLFTDLVGHTAMMQRLGDDQGRKLLREHERITRDLLHQYGGAEIKTLGDGFMASFASVTRAMDCAIALQRAVADRDGEPLQVRVGLNAGEPIEEDGDLFGSAVIMASRIASKAAAGEILIPEPLRHLLTGKSYVYADRGETILKGFEDAVRLYEVRWRE